MSASKRARGVDYQNNYTVPAVKVLSLRLLQYGINDKAPGCNIYFSRFEHEQAKLNGLIVHTGSQRLMVPAIQLRGWTDTRKDPYILQLHFMVSEEEADMCKGKKEIPTHTCINMPIGKQFI